MAKNQTHKNYTPISGNCEKCDKSYLAVNKNIEQIECILCGYLHAKAPAPKTLIETIELIDELKDEFILLEEIRATAKKVIEHHKDIKKVAITTKKINAIYIKNDFYNALEKLEHLVTE